MDFYCTFTFTFHMLCTSVDGNLSSTSCRLPSSVFFNQAVQWFCSCEICVSRSGADLNRESCGTLTTCRLSKICWRFCSRRCQTQNIWILAVFFVVVTSVALYGSETWTLEKNDERFINALETRWWRRRLKIKWTDRITNDEVFRRAKEEGILLKILKNRRAPMNRSYN